MNGGRHLAETLTSVLTQPDVAFDLVVSDDRSDDDTRTIVRRVAGDRARLVLNSERLGLAGNWNHCVGLTETPFVAIVHQDDVLLPGHLAAHVSAFEGDESLGLVASASTVIDASGRDVPETVIGRGGLGPIDVTFRRGDALTLVAIGNPLRCSAVSLRKAAHRQVGGFDSTYRYAVDWEFWARIAEHWAVRWLARPTVAVRWHLASETHRFRHGTADLDESEAVFGLICDRLETTGTPTSGIRTRGRRALAHAYLNRAYTAARAGEVWLARRSLRRALSLSPSTLKTLAADPRLAARMALIMLAPRLSARRLTNPP